MPHATALGGWCSLVTRCTGVMIPVLGLAGFLPLIPIAHATVHSRRRHGGQGKTRGEKRNEDRFSQARFHGLEAYVSSVVTATIDRHLRPALKKVPGFFDLKRIPFFQVWGLASPLAFRLYI